MLLAACGSTAPPPVVENLVPADYKAPIMEAVHRLVDDPTGIRDAVIAEPTLKQHGNVTRYVACFRFNAKNNQGQYTGIREMAGFYYGGRLTQITNVDRALCGGVNYQPFPELMRMCREINCKT